MGHCWLFVCVVVWGGVGGSLWVGGGFGFGGGVRIIFAALIFCHFRGKRAFFVLN